MFAITSPFQAIAFGEETATAPVRLVILAHGDPSSASATLVEIRRFTGGRSYLAALADRADRVVEWFELWIQHPGDLAESPAARCGWLTNASLDQAWHRAVNAIRDLRPDDVIETGWAGQAQRPLVVDLQRKVIIPATAEVGQSPLLLCRDDARLVAAGKAPYQSSRQRFFESTTSTGEVTWIAANAVSLPSDGSRLPLNPGAGYMLLRRFRPLNLERFSDWLRATNATSPETVRNEGDPEIALISGLEDVLLANRSESSPQASRFFERDPALESLYLRVELWHRVVKEACAAVRTSAQPFFNFTADSFRVSLEESGSLVPTPWSFSVSLVRPGSSIPFTIPDHGRCFVPCGSIDESSVLERFGGWQSGAGTVRLSHVTVASPGRTQLEGFIDGAGLRNTIAHEIVWVQVPIDNVALTFLATLEGEVGGVRTGARFKALLDDPPAPILARLKSAAAPRRPCQFSVLRPIDPALDVHALGLIGLRILLAKDDAMVSELVDDVIDLAGMLPEVCDVAQLGMIADSPGISDRLRRLLSASEWLGVEEAAAVPRELWHAIVRVITSFVAIQEDPERPFVSDEANVEWMQPMASRLLELERLAFYLRGLLTSPRPMHEEIARAVHRFVRSER